MMQLSIALLFIVLHLIVLRLKVLDIRVEASEAEIMAQRFKQSTQGRCLTANS